jgi:hypothetical protein
MLMRCLRYLWAAPYTVPGAVLGLFVVLLGGGFRIERGVLEFCGGSMGRGFARLPRPFAFSAMTLGHVILAVDRPALSLLRKHEHVHVQQYERWGPLFLPAYLLSSLVQWLRGRDPYLENHFERQAFALAKRPKAR